jgi:hypothetical protein
MLGHRRIGAMPAPASWNAQDMASLRAASHVTSCPVLLWLLDVPTPPIILLAVPVRFLEGGDGPGARARDATALSIGCEEDTVNNIVWWVGAIVIILAILGFLGLR